MLERFRSELSSFGSRPFDRAASKLAYKTATAVPIILGVGLIFKAFEPRSIEASVAMSAIGVGAAALSWLLKRRIGYEARNNDLKLSSPSNQDRSNTPPTPPTGGTL